MRPTRLLPVAAAAALLVLAVALRSPSPAAPAAGGALAAARVDAARATYEAYKASAAVGRDPAEAIYTWSVRWLTAQVDAGARPAAALEDHLQRMKELETAVKARHEQGLAAKTESLAAAYYRAEAEHWAARKKLK